MDYGLSSLSSSDIDIIILLLLLIYGVCVLLCWCFPRAPKAVRYFFTRYRSSDSTDNEADSRRNRRRRRGRRVHGYVENYFPYSAYPNAPIFEHDRKYFGQYKLPSYHSSLAGSLLDSGSFLQIIPKTPSPNNNNETSQPITTQLVSSCIINENVYNQDSSDTVLVANNLNNYRVLLHKNIEGLSNCSRGSGSVSTIQTNSANIQEISETQNLSNSVISLDPPVYTSRTSLDNIKQMKNSREDKIVERNMHIPSNFDSILLVMETTVKLFVFLLKLLRLYFMFYSPQQYK